MPIELTSRRRDASGTRGFTLIELVVVSAVLALLVAVALPSYLGVRSKAALDEANEMANEWKALAWACYLQTSDVTQCTSNAAIGFTEQNGRYWNWVSGSAVYATNAESSGSSGQSSGNGNGNGNGKGNGNGNGVGNGEGNCGQNNGNGNGGQDNGNGNGCGESSSSSTTGATELMVSWPSANAGLENGETYTVTLFVAGPSEGQASFSCIPNNC